MSFRSIALHLDSKNRIIHTIITEVRDDGIKTIMAEDDPVVPDLQLRPFAKEIEKVYKAIVVKATSMVLEA